MLKKFGWGAGVALLSAAAIAGCGSKSKGSTTIIGGSGDLSNQDQVPFSSIAQNNLAIDGNAFSNNGQSFKVLKVTFNNVASVSSGSTGGDGSAMVIFSTADNNTTGFNNVQRIWASHWDGQNFTPPVELDGEDRDSTITSGDNRQTVVNNILMCPLNVKNYKDASGNSLQAVNDNDGNWVIVWDAQTSFQTPINSDSVNGPRQATPADGPHKALYYTLFVKSLRTKSTASSTILGTSGGTAGAAREYRYGFLHSALEIETLQGGTVDLDTGNGNAGSCRKARPAEDVIGYMFASDTIRGTGSNKSTDDLAGNVSEPSPLDVGTEEAGLVQRKKLGPSTTNTGTIAAPTGAGTAGPSSASYVMGDDTTFLRLFYTQIASSRPGSTYTAGTSGNGNNSQQGGQRYALFSAAFKLDTLTFETPAEFTAWPTKRATSGTQPWSVQPLPNLKVYNQHVFVRYLDASMSSEDGAGASSIGFQLNVGELSQAMAVLTLNNNGAGTNTITTANAHDITLLGSSGKHYVVNTQVTLAGPNGKNANGSSEGVDWASGALGDRDGASIYGADEGLEDTTVFVIVQADTIDVSGATSATTEELRLVSAGIKADGTILTGSPKIVSTHAAQKTGNTAGGLFTGDNNSTTTTPSDSKAQSLRQLVSDSVVDFGTRMSRDGNYVMCAFRQFDGTTLGATLLLNAVCYRTQRVGASVATAFDQRFSVVKKLSTASIAQTESLRTDISTTGAGSLQETQGTKAGKRDIFSAAQGAGTDVGDFSRLLDGSVGNNTGTLKSSTTPIILAFMPVNKFFFQGNLGYACGYQSDVNKMSVFWVCQDGTEDRVWGGTITTTIPTAAGPATLASTEAEFESSASVAGPGVPNLGAASGPQDCAQFSVVKSTFRFIPFSVQNGDFATTDAGVTSAGVGGNVLVNFAKIVDGTTTDGNFFDQEIISVLFDGTTTSTRVVLSRKFHENAQNANQYGAAYSGGVKKLIDTGTFENGFKTANVRTISTPNNSDFSTKPSYGPEAVHVIFNAPIGDTANSAAGLWTRGLDSLARSQSTFTGSLGDSYFPIAAATAAANVDPVRMDRNLGTNANFDGSLQKTTTVAVAIRGDGHEWISLFQNSKWSQDSNGAPAPGLFDNDSSQNVQGVQLETTTDKNCDNLTGSLFFYTKQDAQGNGTDIRLRVRAGTQ